MINLSRQENVIENRSGNHEWTIQKHWQHWLHKTHYKDKQTKIYNTKQKINQK